MFEEFFERSADPIWVFDPQEGIFVDCNQAAVCLMGSPDKNELLRKRPEDLSPARQADGGSSRERVAQIIQRVQENGSWRFEWLVRRFDGEEIPLEVLSTLVHGQGRPLHIIFSRDIRERKRAEAALRESDRRTELLLKESEARARILVEHAPEAMVVVDLETGRFADVNQNAALLFGFSREELLKLGPAEVSPALQPDGRPSMDVAREKLLEALEGGTPAFEWWHRNADGRVVPCEVRLVRLPAQGRRLIRGSITDHTERQRRARVEKAIYQISEAVHTTDDLDSLYRQIHSTIQGLMPANNFYIALYDPVTELFSFPYFVDEMDPPPGPRKLTTGLTSYVLKTGKPLLVNRQSRIRKNASGVAVLVNSAGEVPYVEAGTPAAVWLGVPLHSHGHIMGVLAVQDYREEQIYGEEEKRILTFVAEQTAAAIERKRSAQALRDSEAKFRALFEASSQGVMLHDQEKFLEVNPATVRILGYNRASEIIGKHPAETSAPIQPNGQSAEVLAKEHIAQCMSKGSVRFEWLARNPRGEDVPIEVILTRIPMGGRPIIQAVINDISERKKAEAELLRALAREKELGQLKSNFVSMVSHEFRTPLGIIMSSAEILRDYLDHLDPADRTHHLDSITKNTRRMADLMEEVLLLARFEAGKLDFKPSSMDLGSFSRRLVDEVHSATHRRCPIALVVKGDISHVHADERLLRHIFINLLTNAAKYSEPDTPVTFELSVDGTDVVCTVSDRGIGIPEADLEWVFNAFHRGRNVGNRPGSGLGLVIVKRCVDVHGGRIKIETKMGEGTTIRIRLPLLSKIAN